MKAFKDTLRELATELVAHGLKVFYSEYSDTYLFTTNGKVVLCVYEDMLGGGIAVSLVLIPSHKNGSSARIIEPDQNPTAETIAEAAEYLSDTTIAKLHKYNQLVEPLKDRQLFYKDANEWRDQYWAKLIEFKP